MVGEVHAMQKEFITAISSVLKQTPKGITPAVRSPQRFSASQAPMIRDFTESKEPTITSLRAPTADSFIQTVR